MKRRMLVWLIMISVLFPTVIQAAEDPEDFDSDFTAVLNPDRSVTIEGIFIPKPFGEVKLSLMDDENTPVTSHTVTLNEDGYFTYTAEPNDKEITWVSVLAGKKQIAFSIGRSYSREIERYKRDLQYKQKYGNFDPIQAVQRIDTLKKRIIAGDNLTYFVDDGGQLWVWGMLGPQLCSSDKVIRDSCDQITPKKIPGLDKVKQIAANGRAGAVLSKDGVIRIWGVNDEWNAPLRIAKIPDAVQIAIANNGDGLVLRQNGTVEQWTVSTFPDEEITSTALKLTKLESLANIKKIKIGTPTLYGTTFLALDTAGVVWAWGDVSVIDSANQAENKKDRGAFVFKPVNVKEPLRLSGFPAIQDIETNSYVPLFVSENAELWTYVDTDFTFVKMPGKVAEDVAAIFTDSPYVLKKDGRFYEFTLMPDSLSMDPASEFNDYSMILYGDSSYYGASHFVGVKRDGTLMSWGSNSRGQLGIGKPSPFVWEPKSVKGIIAPKMVAASESHVLSLTNDGSLYGWGRNSQHEIRGGSSDDILTPYRIGTFPNVKKIEAGNGFSLLLNESGDVLVWGAKNRLGIESTTDAGIPEKINAFTEPVIDISAYGHSATVLTKSGKVFHMGIYYNKATAVSETGYRIQQVEIDNVTSIALGDEFGWAVKNDGTVWQWKWWWAGDRIVAKKISGFADIVQLAAARTNGDYLIAIDKQGELWAWGDNSAPQLSRNLPSKLTKPTKITDEPSRITTNGLTDASEKLTFKSVSASRGGALVLTRNNEMLFLGFPAGSLRNTNLYNNVKWIETAGSNMYWVVNDRLWVLGSNNYYGQLGVGTKEFYGTPQTVITDM